MKRFIDFIKGKPRWISIATLTLTVIGWLLSGLSIKRPGIIYLCWLLWIVSFRLGIFAFRITVNRVCTRFDKSLANFVPALPIIVGIAMTLVISDIFFVRYSQCRGHLFELGHAVKAYCERNKGDFPKGSKWCDILLSEPNKIWGKKEFFCPDIEESGLSGYAMNKNLAGKTWNQVDPNTVILFESVPGWNQNGGQELIRFNKHSFPPASKKVNVICRGKDKPKFIIISKGEIKNLRWEP